VSAGVQYLQRLFRHLVEIESDAIFAGEYVLESLQSILGELELRLLPLLLLPSAAATATITCTFLLVILSLLPKAVRAWLLSLLRLISVHTV
jgi:hypothetical protein